MSGTLQQPQQQQQQPTPEQLPSLREFCGNRIDQLFDQHKFAAMPSLQPFQPIDGALLQLKHGVSIPTVPGQENEPILLLSDLDNAVHNADYKESDAYKYIKRYKEIYARAFYATSGAGKTRRIFEYLSINRGLYFLGGAAGLVGNWGSSDLQHCYCDGLESNSSDENYNTVTMNIRIIVFVRCLIFDKITEKLGKEPSAFQWLLFQLFPNAFLGGDIFQQVSRYLQRAGRCDPPRVELTESKLRDAIELDLTPAAKSLCKTLIVDEAQNLLHDDTASGYFVSEKDPVIKRTGFSGVMKAFYRLQKDFDGMPLFAGTGLSFESMDETMESMMGKGAGTYIPPRYFHCFDVYDANDVEEYVSQSIDLSDISAPVKSHVFTWLRGRPRWTASG